MATKKTAATTKEVKEIKEKTEKKSQPAMTEKEKLIAELNAKMQKKHGNAFMSANDAKVDYYSTSSLALDSVLGNQNSLGGFPKGRIIEIFGKEGSGKTTISLLAAAEEIRNGGFVLFIDAENAIDPYRVATLGIPVNDPTKFQIIQPDNGEEVFEVAEEYITSGLASMIIIDSVTAIVPKVILEGGYDSSNMGIQARFMSQALRKLTSVANKTKTSIIFINQTRMNIGWYGNPETTTGGMALKFFASQRIRVASGASDKIVKDSEVIGQNLKVRVEKNKVGIPGREAVITVSFLQGFDKYLDLLEIGKKSGVITQANSFYSFTLDGEKVQLHGKEKLIQYIQENDIFEKLKDLVVKTYIENTNNALNSNIRDGELQSDIELQSDKEEENFED